MTTFLQAINAIRFYSNPAKDACCYTTTSVNVLVYPQNWATRFQFESNKTSLYSKTKMKNWDLHRLGRTSNAARIVEAGRGMDRVRRSADRSVVDVAKHAGRHRRSWSYRLLQTFLKNLTFYHLRSGRSCITSRCCGMRRSGFKRRSKRCGVILVYHLWSFSWTKVRLLLRLVFSQISKKLLVDGDYTGFDEGVN